MNSPGFLSRLMLALGCFVRVLVDARFAEALRRWMAGEKPADEGVVAPKPLPAVEAPVPASAPKLLALAPSAPTLDAKAGARVMLALLQREGRFVDFLEQPVDGFTDAEVGAAARVVHAGCKKALAGRVGFEPVLKEDEGARIALSGSEPDVVVVASGSAKAGSFTVVHRGWRIVRDELPALAEGHDGSLVQPAEVE